MSDFKRFMRSNAAQFARRSLSWHKLDERKLIWILWIAASIALLRDAHALLINVSTPLLNDHAYRQTQTAITAFWARRDGVRLAYETPIYGYPWSIPLEFPFYQWLVATLNIVGIPIDVGGRLLSFGFMVACAWPFAILRKALALPRYVTPLLLVLFFCAPIYAYWGRAVLIETCALFLSLLWLAIVVTVMRVSRPAGVAACAVAAVGSLAMLQKATTFPVFGLIGGGCILAKLAANARRRDVPASFRSIGFGIAACLIPLVVGLVWIRYSDDVKLLNPLAESLTSRAMAVWNYGTWAQRYSADLWKAIVRAAEDVFGDSAILAALVIGYGVLTRRHSLLIAIALLGFFAFFAIFTNLHIRHNYYQVANAIFLIAAAALALTSVLESKYALIGLALLGAIVVGQDRFFADRYAWALHTDFTKDDHYRIARRVRAMTEPGQAILVLGQDYSSVINYYSERKGIALTTALPRDVVEKVLHDPDAFLGGMRLGAVVACRPFEFPYETNEPLIDAYLARHRVLATEGSCEIFAPSKDKA